MMDDREIIADHKRRMGELETLHGSIFSVPSIAITLEQERTRAMFVMLKAEKEGLSASKALSDHGVLSSIAQEMGADSATPGKRVKRSDKYRAILDWCAENVGETVTPNSIAEVGGVSYSTANEFIKSRVDLFSKVKRGQYTVRNPELDRVLDKQ